MRNACRGMQLLFPTGEHMCLLLFRGGIIYNPTSKYWCNREGVCNILFLSRAHGFNGRVEGTTSVTILCYPNTKRRIFGAETE